KYSPPGGTNSIDGGTWKTLATAGPFADGEGYKDPSLYQTIKATDIDGDGKAELVARTHLGIVTFEWNGAGWPPGPTLATFTDSGCAAPRCCVDFRTGDLTGAGSDALVGRDASGVSAWSASPAGAAWSRFDVPTPGGGPFADQSPSGDCPFGGSADGSGDCL